MKSPIAFVSAVVFSTNALAPYSGLALPQGGVVGGGFANVFQSSPSQLNVTQSSNRAVIDWRSFDVGTGERVAISQPSSSSILLNRIHDNVPSQIYGSISANGQVILSNPNGMVFGPSSRVDVSGLIATTARIDSKAFLDHGRLQGNPGTTGARILAEGEITAKAGGLVALVAPEVRHSGHIVAKAGRVQLASGDTVAIDLYGDQLVSVAASPQMRAALTEHDGIIEANGGNVVLSAAQATHLVDSAVNLDGVVEASGLIEENGVIRTAGEIAVTGRELVLGHRAELNADGPQGGGLVQVGGGWQGQGPLPWADSVTAKAGATISADAIKTGNGGTVVLWSGGHSEFNGAITANGGSIGGNGGRIETSGLKTLQVGHSASVAAAAPKGKGGAWLLDPTEITINAGAGANTASNVYADNIQSTLNTGTSVTVQTSGANGDIVSSGTPVINKTAGGDATFTLKAHGNIDLSGMTVNSSSNKLDTILWADSDNSNSGYVRLRTGTNITTNGGDFVAGGGLDDGGVDDGIAGGIVGDSRPDNYAWGNATIGDGIRLNAASVSTGSGSMRLLGRGHTMSSTSLDGVSIEAGSLVSTTSGGISFHGIGGTGSNNNYGVSLVDSTVTSLVGDISFTGTGGGTGSENLGVNLYNGTLSSTGTGATAGDITLYGVGSSSGVNYNIGVNPWNGSHITTVDGDIRITGIGRGSGTNNYGIWLESGSDITSSGTGAGAGKIIVDGTAANSTTNNFGIYFTGSAINSVDGDIAVTAVGRGTGTAGYGLNLTSNSGIVSTGGADIDITATGNSGSTSDIRTATGTNAIGGANMTGDILLQADNIAAANVAVQSRNNITVTPRTDSTTVGLAGATGTLNLTAAELALFAADVNNDGTGSFTIGRTDGTGAFNVNPYASWNSDTLFQSGTGALTFAAGAHVFTGEDVIATTSGALTLNGTLTAGTAFLQTTGTSADITIGVTGGVTASGSGTALTLASGQNIVNNRGAAALSAASGRWLVYSTSPGADTIGGLASTFRRYSCAYGGSCPSFPATGNGLLYSSTPILTVTPNGQSVVYGSAADMTGYGYALTGYNTGDAATDTVGGSLDGSTAYVAGNDVNTYGLTYDSGTLTSALGYGFNYVGNALAITVTAKPLTASLMGSVSKTYNGNTNATLAAGNYSLSGVFGSDAVSVATTSGSYDTKNVGTGKTVNVTGMTLTGAKAGNYTLNSTSASGSVGEIVARSLSITGVTANNKTYDGTAAAVLSTSGAMLSGAVGGDVLSLDATSATGSFANKNAGIGKTVTATGFSFSGLEAGNYALTQPAGLTADVTAKTLNVAADAKTKVYGTSDPALTYAYSGLETGDGVSGALTRTAGENAGTYAIGQGSLDAGSNYALSYTGANLGITPAPLTVTAGNAAREEGAANPSFTYAVSGLYGGDSPSLVSGVGFSTPATPASATGSYVITPSGGIVAGGNYTVSGYVDGILTVTAATTPSGGGSVIPSVPIPIAPAPVTPSPIVPVLPSPIAEIPSLVLPQTVLRASNRTTDTRLLDPSNSRQVSESGEDYNLMIDSDNYDLRYHSLSRENRRRAFPNNNTALIEIEADANERLIDADGD